MKKYFLILPIAVLALTACKFGTPKLNEHNIDRIVAAMTLEEKAALVVGISMDSGVEGLSATIGNSADRVPGAAGATHAIERLGIPSTILADGPAGLRINPTREGDDATYYCTHFPIGTLLASTWDQQLVEQVGEAIGEEVLEYGCDVLLAPAENIHRNPLCGRNFEYYSEDPLLSGKTAAAYVRGVQKNGVGTSVKHFAYNNQETNRTGNNVVVSARAQREIYLRGFEYTVRESDPWTIMSSYNLSNGIYTSENPELLQDVLRDEWGFNGIVMTDWYGGKDAAAQMHAGNDMLQPGRPSQYEDIIEAVKEGTLDMDELDRNVKRILEYIVRTPSFKGYKFSNKPDLEAHATVTRQSATEGMVLLKNGPLRLAQGKLSSAQVPTLPTSPQRGGEKVLPLDVNTTKRAAVFGVTSYDFIAGGTGSGNVNRAYTVSLLDGLSNAGIVTDEALSVRYTAYLEECKARAAEQAAKSGGNKSLTSFLPPALPEEFIPSAAELKAASQTNDIAIITLGRISGEFVDRTAANFELSRSERQLITTVTRAFHQAGKRCIVVLNIGGVIETASWRDMPDAILLAWQAGQEGGNSVADILTGKANPSGKLPMTWPLRAADHASTANFPKAENFELDLSAFLGGGDEEKAPRYTYDWTVYEEGIYVGYRWFDKQHTAVAYPFGYGLSYTTFAYSDAAVEYSGEEAVVRIKITNDGKVAGKEAVQLYAAAPGKDMDKPEQELRAYAKTKLLAPGESETVEMRFATTDLASFNEELSSWVVEEGTYELRIGASSRDIRATLPLSVKGKTWRVNDVLHKQEGDPSVRKVSAKEEVETRTDAEAFEPFYGEWEVEVLGIPTGDVEMVMLVTEAGETARVKLTAYKVVSMEITDPKMKGDRLVFTYEYDGMPIPLWLRLEPDGTLKGLMMNSFKMKGKKKA